MYQSLYGDIDLEQDKELERSFKRILLFSPPSLSNMLLTNSWSDIYKTIINQYIEPIVTNILNSTSDLEAFSMALLDFGLSSDIPIETLTERLEILINFWCDSSRWLAPGRVKKRELSFNDYDISEVLPIGQMTDKQFWKGINQALSEWMHLRPECLNLSASNSSYFYTFLAYEVLIVLNAKLSKASIDLGCVRAHFKALTLYIHDKEKNTGKTRIRKSFQPPPVTTLNEINSIQKVINRLLITDSAIICTAKGTSSTFMPR